MIITPGFIVGAWLIIMPEMVSIPFFTMHACQIARQQTIIAFSYYSFNKTLQKKLISFRGKRHICVSSGYKKHAN